MKSPTSNRLILLGVIVFAIGAGLVFVGLRSGDQPRGVTRAEAVDPGRVSAQTGEIVAPPAAPALPRGTEGLTLQLAGEPSLLGYVGAGDRINIYATVKSAKDPLPAPFSKLIAAGVSVLDVTGPPAGTSGDSTFLLAVSRADAERLIFLAKFESLWFTLASPEQRGGADTPGRGYPNVFTGGR